MSEDQPSDASEIRAFHAHLYFRSPAERSTALALRDEIAAGFPEATLGRVRDEAVGPHPSPMYQVAFAPELFASFVPFLMLRRAGLSVLVHPLTGDHYAEHTSQAAWLGDVLPLRVEIFTAGASSD